MMVIIWSRKLMTMNGWKYQTLWFLIRLNSFMMVLKF